MQCRADDKSLDVASQHKSSTYKCSSGRYGYTLDGDCPYVGQQLLQKVSESKNGKYRSAFDHDDDTVDDDVVKFKERFDHHW